MMYYDSRWLEERHKHGVVDMKIKRKRTNKIAYQSTTNTVISSVCKGYLPCIEIRDCGNGDLRAGACIYGKEDLRKLIEVLNVVLCDLPEDPVSDEED